MTFIHDPQAVLDYTLDWAAWLNGDTIDDATWTVPTGLTATNQTTTATTATVWISGGTLAQTYALRCHVTTAQGRQDDRTLTLVVRDR